jgi:hypothetical protein
MNLFIAALSTSESLCTVWERVLILALAPPIPYRHQPAPFIEQMLIFVLGPPIMAGLFWLKARGWARTVQGETVSETTKRRQKIEFWVVLSLGYLISVIGAAYELVWPYHRSP